MAIKHKRTNDPDYIWFAGDLEVGQIGVNTANGTLHVRNVSTNQVETIKSLTNVSDLFNDAGYLTTETDPTVPGHVKSITTTNINNWNSAHSWGNHALAGYLTTETDPVFTASAAAGITNSDIGEWNTAYNWGNHADAGYLTSLSSTPINDLSNVNISAPAMNDMLVYNSTTGAWVNRNKSNAGFSTVASSGSYNDLLNTPTNLSSFTNDTNFITIGDVPVQAVNGKTGVVFLNTDDIQQGTNNKYFSDSLARGAISVSGSLNYNSITGVISYTQPTNVSAFTNDAGYITSFTETDPTVPSHVKAITTTNINTWNTAVQPESLATVATTGSYTDLTNKPSIPSSLLDLGISDGTSGQVLTTNGAGTFTFTTVSGSGGASALDDLTDVVLTSPSAGEVLKFNGTEWVNAPDAGGGTGGDPGGAFGQVQYNNLGAFDGTSQLVIDSNSVVLSESLRLSGRTITIENDPWNTASVPNQGRINIGNGNGSNVFSTNTAGTAEAARLYVENTFVADGDQAANQRRVGLAGTSRVNNSVTLTNNDRFYGSSSNSRYTTTNGTSWTNNNAFTLVGSISSFANDSTSSVGIGIGAWHLVQQATAGGSINYGIGVNSNYVQTANGTIGTFYNYVASQFATTGTFGDSYAYYIPAHQNSGLDHLSSNQAPGSSGGNKTGKYYGFYNNNNRMRSRIGAIQEAHEVIEIRTHNSGSLQLDVYANTCWQINLNANITDLSFTGTNSTLDSLTPVTLIIVQDATGGRTIAWPAGTKFAGGVNDIDTAANSVTFASVLIHSGVHYVTIATYE